MPYFTWKHFYFFYPNFSETLERAWKKSSQQFARPTFVGDFAESLFQTRL